MDKMRALRRSQLDRLFAEMRSIGLHRPKSGWVREIRKALGMSQQDLANRLGVIQQRVEKIEKDELKEKLTLETMQKTAEALNCRFVYYFEPKKTLEMTVENQARKLAEQLAHETDMSMKLEMQGTDRKHLTKMINELTEELVRKNDRQIWKISWKDKK